MKEAARSFQLAELTYHETYAGWGAGETGLLRQVAIDDTKMKDYANAERILKDCIEGLSRHYGDSFEQLPFYYSDLGWVLELQDKHEEALSAYKRIEVILREAHREKEYLYPVTAYHIWENSYKTKDFATALKYAKLYASICDPDSVRLAYLNLSYTYLALGKTEQEFAAIQEGISKIKSRKDAKPMDLYLMKEALTQYYARMNQLTTAEKLEEEVVGMVQAMPFPPTESKEKHLAAVYCCLGSLQYQLHKYKEARQTLRKSAEYSEPLGKDQSPVLKNTLAIWLEACKAEPNAEEAASVQARLKKLD
jgi:tetratricopeptide (TPR) repeat protein